MGLILGFGVVGLLMGCDGSKDGDDTSVVVDDTGVVVDDTGTTEGSIPADVQAVFDGSCAGCHTGGGTNGGLSLDASDAWDNTVDVAAAVGGTRISCGDAAGSVVYSRMADGSMPPGGGVSEADLATVGDWIDGGCQ